MLKSLIPYLTYLILSVVVILFSQYTHTAAMFVVAFYQYVDSHIEVLFSYSQAGLALRHVIALAICPLIITGIPALLYHAVKKSPMPYFMELTWLFWILIVLSNILVN